MREHDPLVLEYVHLSQFPRAPEALYTLKKVASLVKPIMRARGWTVKELAEFYPDQQNLLGLNVNKGFKICLRLRHPGDKNQFLAVEQVVDTMLHELSHIVHGPHDQHFHKLWDQLRDEHQGLLLKGYTGEGFLSEGKRLGGQTRIRPQEARRIALQAAEKRRKANPLGGSPFGQRLGGLAPRPGDDIRRVIADAAERRTRTLKGCGTERLDENEIRDISDAANQNGFRTKAEEDEANEVAIAQALWELVQEDERAKHATSNKVSSGVLKRPQPTPPPIPPRSRRSVPPLPESSRDSVDNNSTVWDCPLCTFRNPSRFLCCDGCGIQRGGGVGADGVGGGRGDERPRSLESSGPNSNAITRKPHPQAGIKSNSPRRRRSVEIPHFTKDIIDLTSSPPRESPGTFHGEPNRHTTTTASSSAPPRPRTDTQAEIWQCSFCGGVMERKWWTCSVCGKMKDTSH